MQFKPDTWCTTFNEDNSLYYKFTNSLTNFENLKYTTYYYIITFITLYYYIYGVYSIESIHTKYDCVLGI